ncbi:MAG: 5-oxoprolinase subunit B/C family protein [Acidimicrobiales bacterium]
MTRPLGDEAVLFDLEGGYRAAQALARSIQARDVIPAGSTVGVVGAPNFAEDRRAAPLYSTHTVPVVFDGCDVAELGLTSVQLAAELDGLELEVAYLGFMPGFAYLVGLPELLANLPRRASPRTRVPPGSFAVAGGYAGIYPVASPGGWNVLGRTNIRCFDPETPPYALFQPGDRLRLAPRRFLQGFEAPTRGPLKGEDLEVLDPGPLLVVVDLGRVGAGSLGVPRAGAANTCWLQIANRAVGNSDGVPALELSGTARFRAERDLMIAVAGDAELVVDGDTRPPRTVNSVGAGQEIMIGARPRAGRVLVAIGGGLVTPCYFESGSSDPVSGLPPGPLRAGDRLEVGARPARARLRFELPDKGSPVRLRAIDGPDPAEAGTLGGTWVVDVQSDRTGVRLRPAGAQPLAGAGAVASHAVVPGAIQLPPSGQPIILGADSGPVGGYPVPATVITADLWRVGALCPGDLVEIDLVSLASAKVAREQLQQLINKSTTGWFPVAVA